MCRSKEHMELEQCDCGAVIRKKNRLKHLDSFRHFKNIELKHHEDIVNSKGYYQCKCGDFAQFKNWEKHETTKRHLKGIAFLQIKK